MSAIIIRESDEILILLFLNSFFCVFYLFVVDFNFNFVVSIQNEADIMAITDEAWASSKWNAFDSRGCGRWRKSNREKKSE